MLADALGTYVTAAALVAASSAIGAGILAAAGARRLAPTAPVVGLAAAAAVAWWTVRLPGHGLTTLLVLLGLAVVAGAFAARRLEGVRPDLAAPAPAAIAVLLATSIPFAVEGHLGVLGTGFNVDMSQHLFAADWLADPEGLSPSLVRNGYPLGPHALAAAAAELLGAALGRLSRAHALTVATLAALAYLAASYLAQGAFKELYEAAFLIGFALLLRDLALAPERAGRGALALLAPAVIAAGALYVYSWPGLAWLGLALVLWVLAGLVRGGAGRAAVVALLPALLAGAVVLAVAAAPELDRITKFGTSVGAVAERAPGSTPGGGGAGGDGGRGRRPARLPAYDNDLGNLFGQVNPASVFGIWPSGDFRVEPGDGAVPAPVFWLGALLGALALAFGVVAAARRGETALLAALAAAAAIWLAARIASTPYTAAKALQMAASPVMLIAAWAALDRAAPVPLRERWSRIVAAGGLAFVVAAALSSALVLVNAPVGPDDYTPGVRKLSNRFAGEPTLLLAPADTVADQRGAEFFGWELRGASAATVAALPGGGEPPAGVSRVLVVGGAQEPPFEDLKRIGSANRVVLWRVVEDAG
ncbi:MAG: hypothetical protein EDQ89_04690 [Acidobacteria bacterium]|nr:MAG: hypothetical protein EDQ89_04690 [Acidobacteriota bacterium]